MDDGFLEFRSLISTAAIKVAYLIGAVIITIISIIQMVVSLIAMSGHKVIELLQPFAEGDQGLRLFLSILSLILGNLFWRLFCEGWILLFSIHEILASIEKELRRRDSQ